MSGTAPYGQGRGEQNGKNETEIFFQILGLCEDEITGTRQGKGRGGLAKTSGGRGAPRSSSVATSVARIGVGAVSAQQGPTVGTFVSQGFFTVGTASE